MLKAHARHQPDASPPLQVFRSTPTSRAYRRNQKLAAAAADDEAGLQQPLMASPDPHKEARAAGSPAKPLNRPASNSSIELTQDPPHPDPGYLEAQSAPPDVPGGHSEGTPSPAEQDRQAAAAFHGLENRTPSASLQHGADGGRRLQGDWQGSERLQTQHSAALSVRRSSGAWRTLECGQGHACNLCSLPTLVRACIRVTSQPVRCTSRSGHVLALMHVQHTGQASTGARGAAASQLCSASCPEHCFCPSLSTTWTA